MATLTGLLYAVLVVYLGGWYTGYWTGNFSLLLLILTTVTLGFWIAERFRFAPQRRAAALELDRQEAARRDALAAQGITRVDAPPTQARDALLAQPWWLDWTAGLFPVILVVFLVRSFVAEPFKIPSGSMIPTLLVGDLILVNKFHYGIRLPVINKKIIENHDPQRGDVMVFRYPLDPSQDYIKRVVGIAGDTVSFHDQRVHINGQALPLEALPPPGFYEEGSMRFFSAFKEKLGSVEHRILMNPSMGHTYGDDTQPQFPFRENCHYGIAEVTCKVPPGHYFMMGDNRDNSQDSRYWGFVPDANIVGKAFFIWMNFSNIRRFGGFD